MWAKATPDPLAGLRLSKLGAVALDIARPNSGCTVSQVLSTWRISRASARRERSWARCSVRILFHGCSTSGQKVSRMASLPDTAAIVDGPISRPTMPSTGCLIGCLPFLDELTEPAPPAFDGATDDADVLG